jgi:hypothetical protein
MSDSNRKIAEVYRAKAKVLLDLAAKTADPELRRLREIQAQALQKQADILDSK